MLHFQQIIIDNNLHTVKNRKKISLRTTRDDRVMITSQTIKSQAIFWRWFGSDVCQEKCTSHLNLLYVPSFKCKQNPKLLDYMKIFKCWYVVSNGVDSELWLNNEVRKKHLLIKRCNIL